MQRGTVRPRSPSPEEASRLPDSPSYNPHKRLRQSAARPSLVYPLNSSLSSSLSPIEFTNPHSTTSPPTPTSAHMDRMGHPMPSSNGTNGDADAGPSTSTHTNGHSGSASLPEDMLAQVQHVQPPGKLMYEDDNDWVELQQTGESPGLVGAEDGEGAEEGRVARRKPGGRPGVGGGKRMPVDREEVVRLILQGLRDIGYHGSADVLEAESGYTLATRQALDFQSAILNGRWSESLSLLPELGIAMPDSTEEQPVSSRSSIASGKTRAVAAGKGTTAEQVKFLVAQQKYLELLEQGQQKKALAVLRNELAPVTKDSEVLHTISGFMMCLDKDDLHERAMWDGASGSSRRQLLEHLQAFIPPQIMVPSRRLATLFDQARRHQQQSCLYHEDPDPASLYTDHECASGQFPSVTTHILADHTDEVWRIEWSPDGMMLASAGKDRAVVIWQLKATPKERGGVQYSVIPLHHLRDHRDPVDAIAWSRDGKTLVTGADKSLYLWDTTTGMQKATQMGESQHKDTISNIQWLPDGSGFVVASMDCRLIFYEASGRVLRSLAFPNIQLNDFGLTPDGTRLVAIFTNNKRATVDNKLKPSMSARPVEEPMGGVSGAATGGAVADVTGGFGYGTMEHGLMVVRIEDKEIVDFSADLRCEITSLRLSSDGKRVIVSCSPDEVQMWTIDPHLRFLRKFTGHVQGRFLIRSCFGAPKDRFVLSGSEDGHVYVWQSNSPTPIEVLSGHGDVVNAVAWNPVASRRIFASCSDDQTIRIWQPPVGDETMEGDEVERGAGMGEDEGMVL